jgi:bacterial/archaeal transporter family-2 protein
MRTFFMLLAVLAGAALPIQASINAEFAARGATPLWAAGISAALTALTLAAVASLFLRIPAPSPALFTKIPPWLWCGGFLGVIVLGVMSSVPQRIGAATMIVCFIAGQVICSMVLDHFGALGLPQQSISAGRLMGAAMIVGGVTLVRIF